MADVKLIVITPDSGAQGVLTINWKDTRGMSFRRSHIRPISPERLQDGTLVAQTLDFNKKEFSLTVTLHHITIHSYLQTLFESGIGIILQVVYEDDSFVEQDEFNGSCKMTSYDDDVDQGGSWARSVSVVFMEV
jgi:hypothetical protein